MCPPGINVYLPVSVVEWLCFAKSTVVVTKSVLLLKVDVSSVGLLPPPDAGDVVAEVPAVQFVFVSDILGGLARVDAETLVLVAVKP